MSFRARSERLSYNSTAVMRFGDQHEPPQQIPSDECIKYRLLTDIPDDRMSRQRSSIEIMTELLELAMEARRRQFQTDGGVPVSKRELMRSANLNYNQLTNYLNMLERKGFVVQEESSEGLFLEITDTGMEFFEQASDVTEMLNNS